VKFDKLRFENCTSKHEMAGQLLKARLEVGSGGLTIKFSQLTNPFS